MEKHPLVPGAAQSPWNLVEGYLIREIVPEAKLAEALKRREEALVVPEYILLEADREGASESLHRAIALEGMSTIGRRYKKWGLDPVTGKCRETNFFQERLDESKCVGRKITAAEFWGTDSMSGASKGFDDSFVDGYKTAFFDPPYGIPGDKVEKAKLLFSEINECLWGRDLDKMEIFSWSTDWSGYFDAGHEWWGAFFWTIRLGNANRFIVIGASSTD